jgi:hypothetical protein
MRIRIKVMQIRNPDVKFTPVWRTLSSQPNTLIYFYLNCLIARVWFLNCAEELGHLILIYQIPVKSFLMNLITYSVHDEQLGLP